MLVVLHRDRRKIVVLAVIGHFLGSVQAAHLDLRAQEVQDGPRNQILQLKVKVTLARLYADFCRGKTSTPDQDLLGVVRTVSSLQPGAEIESVQGELIRPSEPKPLCLFHLNLLQVDGSGPALLERDFATKHELEDDRRIRSLQPGLLGHRHSGRGSRFDARNQQQEKGDERNFQVFHR